MQKTTPKKDFSQNALRVVEIATGVTLAASSYSGEGKVKNKKKAKKKNERNKG